MFKGLKRYSMAVYHNEMPLALQPVPSLNNTHLLLFSWENVLHNLVLHLFPALGGPQQSLSKTTLMDTFTPFSPHSVLPFVLNVTLSPTLYG